MFQLHVSSSCMSFTTFGLEYDKDSFALDSVSTDWCNKRVSDLASKFDKSLATAAKLSDEAKVREVALLEGHIILKKLRDALESLRGRLVGRNKDDVEKAISMYPGTSCTVMLVCNISQGGTMVTYGGMSKKLATMSASSFIFKDFYLETIMFGS
ncbi:Stomatal closure-related actin-binding protein, coiled-coil domain [Dillenia turbinata]|uniref:Stomatal closure-related actin-binding protein, coiled-coil domain n=1 Tax=Dillenia turbinata TaxID=194707 RepID=A0AAN8UP30_9MAGN